MELERETERESESETESEVGVRGRVRVAVGMNSHGVLRKMIVIVRVRCHGQSWGFKEKNGERETESWE